MENYHLGTEGRKYPRVPFKKGVKCQLQGVEASTGELAQDLSEGGIRIRSNEFIPVGQEISVGIQLKDSDEVIEVIGRVVWVRFVPYTEVYQLGIEFNQDATYPRARIGRFAYSA